LFTPLWKRGSNRCIATFHYPPEILQQRVNPGSIKSLDAVIIVGENQREWLSKIIDPNKIHFCPHHVDTAFFFPADCAISAAAHPRLICVGQLFRDYDSLLCVIRLLRTVFGQQVALDIVGPQPNAKHALFAEPDVKVHRGITDEALRDLYRNASVGVLPLTDSTANNALLEMMACGMPVVITDAGGVRDYTQSGGVDMLPIGDNEGFARTVDTLLKNPDLRGRNAALNREYAVRELSLAACAKKLAHIYGSVM
jgi:glycosyltransferase involved in cell wall biosynthesis